MHTEPSLTAVTKRVGRPLGLLMLLGVWASPLALHGYVTQGDARWPDGTVRFELQLGNSPQPLLDGAPSFDAVAQAALEEWSRSIDRLRLEGVAGSTATIEQGNRRNNVFFAEKAFDRDFGDRTVAITFSRWSGSRRVEANIVFNRGEAWDSYRGAARTRGGRSLIDFRRVALHEFGHALGLDHPDEDGQSVSAIMNSRTSNLDTLAPDDITGAQSLYGVRADGGKGGGSTGSTRLANLSVRSRAGAGESTLIVGFATAGGDRPILLRGIGPALREQSVSDPLVDPELTLFRALGDGGSATIASNDNWGGAGSLATSFDSVGAFALPAASADAALRQTLGSGVYSVHLTEANRRSGIGLMELYALGSGSEPGRLVNLSARGHVGRDADILIAGFFVAGEGRIRLLIRALGPALTNLGVGGVLANPQLQIYRGSTVIAANDDWGSDAAAIRASGSSVGAYALQEGSRDAALLIDLPPGGYTAHVSGVGQGTGVGLVEVYVLPD